MGGSGLCSPSMSDSSVSDVSMGNEVLGDAIAVGVDVDTDGAGAGVTGGCGSDVSGAGWMARL